jgi:ketosteroid isomerase-like protein
MRERSTAVLAPAAEHCRTGAGRLGARGRHLLAWVLDFYDRDAVYVNDARDPDAGIHRGIEAVRQQVGRWVEAYPDLQVEPLEIQTSGDKAFVWVRFSGHGAESGVPIDMELAHIVTVKGGKVLRVEEYSDRADGLKAAGLLG